MTRHTSPPVAIVVPPTLTAARVAEIRKEAESDAELFGSMVVDDEDSYTIADSCLTIAVNRRDALVAARKDFLAPVKAEVNRVEALVRTATKVDDVTVLHLKREIGAFRVAQAQAQEDARRLAQDAAREGDADTLHTALAIADSAAEAPTGRATCRFVWRVKRIAEDLLPSEYFVPDRARIDAEAKAWGGGEDPPVIPGVVFERVAQIGVRR